MSSLGPPCDCAYPDGCNAESTCILVRVNQNHGSDTLGELIKGATVLRSGDAVILCMSGEVAATPQYFMDALKATFPDIKWAVIENVSGVMVKHGDTDT